MKWNKLLRFFEGEYDFAGSPVEVSVQAESEDDLARLFAAGIWFQRLLEKLIDVTDAAIEASYVVYSENWAEGRPIRKEAFIEDFFLDSVSLYKSGKSEVSFVMESAFPGHYVNARLESDLTISEVVIEDC